MQSRDPSVLVICSDEFPVTQDVLEDWYRHSPSNHRLCHHQLESSDTAESLLRLLIAEGATAVVFLGAQLPDAVIASRLAGLCTVLVMGEDEAASWQLGDWRDPRVAAPFFAHVVVAIGTRWPTYHESESGIGWGAQYFARSLAELDLRHIVQLAEHQPDRATLPPAKASTFWHVVDELRIWGDCIEDRLDEEARRLRERCLLDLRSKPGGAAYRATRLAPSERGRTKQRVLFVSHELSNTGAPIAMLWAIRGLQSLEAEFELWCIGIGDGPLADECINLVGADRFRVIDYDEDWPHYETFLGAVDEIDPDVVFLNASPVYALAPLLRWKGIPVVWWFHDGINVDKRDGHLFSLRSLESMHRYALASADIVLTASHDTAGQLETFCRAITKPVGVVPYGFDVDALIASRQSLEETRHEIRRELGVPEDGTLFVCVGSLEKRKNQQRLVTAFQAMLRSMPADEARKHALALVGRLDPDNKGPESYYHDILGSLDGELAAQVHIVGPQPSGAPFMAAADCHVLISTNECSPLVNIESMLLETSVISSRVHGIPEVVLDGVRGRLVEPEDDENIEGMLRWFVEARRDSPDLLDQMRREALDYARANHHYEHTGSIVLEAIRKALGSEACQQMRLIGPDVNKVFERELATRWSWMKHDAIHSCFPVHERALGSRSADASLPRFSPNPEVR
ncbi:MAG: glycosyltransferase family 4 protein [Planctomycetota bacterium]